MFIYYNKFKNPHYHLKVRQVTTIRIIEHTVTYREYSPLFLVAAETIRINMKTVFVFAACFVTLASSYPATEKVDLSEVEYDPFAGREPVVDTGYFNSYYPSTLLESFNRRLQEILTSLRESVTGDSTDLVSSFGDLGKGNTTSYTKIVGNHKIEVNETEYKKDTDFGTSHVKISYVNVKPLHPDTIEETTGTPEVDSEPIDKAIDRDRESLETVENEIPNNIDEATNTEIETLDEVIKNNNMINSEGKFSEELQSFPYKQLEDFGVEDLNNDIEMSSRDFENIQPIIDLSNDIRVNDMMQADGAPPNPYAESIY